MNGLEDSLQSPRDRRGIADQRGDQNDDMDPSHGRDLGTSRASHDDGLDAGRSSRESLVAIVPHRRRSTRRIQDRASWSADIPSGRGTRPQPVRDPAERFFDRRSRQTAVERSASVGQQSPGACDTAGIHRPCALQPLRQAEQALSASDHGLAADAAEPQRCAAVVCGGDRGADLDRELVTSQRVNEFAAAKRVQIGALRRDAIGKFTVNTPAADAQPKSSSSGRRWSRRQHRRALHRPIIQSLV